jgi:ubiquinone/menaquinone biosynthesis C-methylase UbiE
LKRFIIGYGEDMQQIDSESIDVVVTGLVDCSVSKLDEMLKEINRVLVPGGKYYFMEHVLDPNKTSLRYLAQKILSFTRMWPLIFDGCDFKNLERVIAGSRCFTTVSMKNFYIDTKGLWVFKFLSPHVSGVATK